MADQYAKAFALTGRAQVRVVCARTEESAARLIATNRLVGARRSTAWREVVAAEDVDIVVLATPHRFHAEQGIAAAENGKHFAIEKPIATNPQDLDRLAQVVRSAGVKTFIGFVLRWNGLYQLIKRLLTEGLVGKPYYLETGFSTYAGPWTNGWPWIATQAEGISTWLNVGIHAVDALRWFASPAQRVEARAVEVSAYASGWRKDFEYPHLGVALVKFEDGTIGKVHSDFSSRTYGVPVRIYGSQGTIHDDKVWLDVLAGQTDWTRIPVVIPGQDDMTTLLATALNDYLDCIDQDLEPPTSVEEAVNTHEICFAAARSAVEGRPVKLPLAGADEREIKGGHSVAEQNT